MIVVHINPVGVEKVCFQSHSALMEDLCLAAWPLVRKELGRLHKKLRKASGAAYQELNGRIESGQNLRDDYEGELPRKPKFRLRE